MPIVPILKKEVDTTIRPDGVSPRQVSAPQPHLAAGDGFALRQNFAQAVRGEVAKKGTVSEKFLDDFAATHFDGQREQAPAVWDYAVLRQAARQENTLWQRQHQAQQTQQEAAWIEQVGVLSPDVSTLNTYLKLQIPSYTAHLKQIGTDPAQAVREGEKLHAQTVEKHILHSLSSGDWQTAQQVFRAQGASLPQPVQQHCVEKIRGAFARCEAQRLWQAARVDGTEEPARTQETALATIQEPDENLHVQIKEEIVRLAQTEEQQQLARQAVAFTRLAQADIASVQQILDTQTALNDEQLHLARKAASQIQQPATQRQQEWFVKNYFNADSLPPAQAFDKGLCGARDYFRLQAARLRGPGGQDEKWLCRGISAWMERQGFSAEDITRATYTVLTGAADSEGQRGVWKNIKTLLTC